MNKFARSAFAVAASGALVFGSAGIAAAQGGSEDETPNSGVQEGQTNEQCEGIVCGSMEAAKDAGMKLHIHKFDNANPGPAGNGTQIEGEGSLGDPLDGATFKVERVTGVDLKTNDGQKLAEQIAKDQAEAPGFSEVGSKTTSNGQAVFDITEIGLYRVTETAAPTGYEATQSDPFFVAVPLTDPDNRQGFLREVHVYPKNKKQEDVVTKSVTDAATVKAGDTITYDVAAKVPSASEFAKVVLTDQYPADRLESPVVQQVSLGDGTVLQDADYTVNTDTAGEVVIALTQSGIDKVVALDGAQRTVQAKIDFNVKENADGQTSPIKNNASITTSTDEDDPGTTVDIPDEDQPETYFGNVTINKTNTAGDGIAATFDLYTCNDANSIEESNKVTEGIQVAAAGTTIKGLHVNDYVNGEAKETDPTGYCLVETEAADGYELLAEPVYFTVEKGEGETIDLTNVNIENVESNAGFDLPLTGGRGVTMLLVLGGVLIVGGGAYAFYSNRRQNAAS
ncbi:SpaH/EbpB family LPXTG-anchored major pilin [Corynebacterium sp. TAE3-ERU30]|uniref:SpaH/EbpB family LPXTG-anchored major pilin n=1 Tax=Corynebacterium sp. TAE3-ERU30 TaxID=2849496 RepID=UPI001C47E000|nr:SpaH/EbpB family LPXTG-anchored major pilin [Corynebacterium sp. TAE3-ERU30]MBV7282595.1 SpaH/EbpB family LPXTG-anchored major pilin [Corynebacterium sp. TAE3-ERU30]